MEVYNKNRDQNNSMHDEIREQNAKLKDAPFKDKLAYFKEYYLKTVILVAVVVIFLGHLVYTMISAPTDTAFAAFFYNDFGDSSSTELIDGFVTYQNIDTKKHSAYIDTTLVRLSHKFLRELVPRFHQIWHSIVCLQTRRVDLREGLL